MDHDDHGFAASPEDQPSRRLFDAIAKGDPEEIRAIFARSNGPISPDEEDGRGCTALYVAARSGKTDCVWELLNAGASVNARSVDLDKGSATALNAALDNGYPDTALALLGRRADPKILDDRGNNALHLAVLSSGRLHKPSAQEIDKIVEVIEKCIAAGVPVDHPDLSDADTPLAIAVGCRAPISVIDLLLARGADPNSENKRCYRAVHGWWDQANIETLKRLAASGADLNAINSAGATALDYSRDIVAADTLLELGADINHVDAEGRNLLLRRVSQPNGSSVRDEVLAHLIGRGLDFERADIRGATAEQYIRERLLTEPAHAFSLNLLAAITAVKTREAMRSAISARPAPPII